MFDIFYIGIKPNLFSHEKQAKSIEHAQELSRTRFCWVVSYLADLNSWDFLWEPAPWQADFVHVWPSEIEGYAAVQLVPKHVTELQYHYHDTVVTSRSRPENYRTLISCNFDYNWLPNPFDPPYIYVFGNQHWPAEIQPTVEYHAPGATERKYMDWPLAELKPNRTNWAIHETVDEQQWDWSWVPDPGDPPYIYVFGNQWNPAEFKASVEYHVPGATERKYMDQRTRRLPNYGNNWRVLLNVEEFDYSWEPNPFDPPYIYVFGNQWYSAEVEPTVEYHVPGATERKYVHDIVARVQPNTTHYYQHCAVESFDYSWHPDPGSPPYIYVFGNQWHAAEIMPTVEYRVPGATEKKYMHDIVAKLPERHDNHWHTREDCEWDYSWVPDPGDPPYIYVFGNQWWPAEKWPTVTYTVPGATEHKYMDSPVAKLLPDAAGWISLIDRAYTFDYSWRPDPGDPPYRYVFGNQWHSAEVMPTLQWLHPAADESTPVKYVDWPRAELAADRTYWTLPAGVNPDSVDFSWVPDPGEPPYIYQFATQHQKTGGPVYTVPGATETKYLEHIEVRVESETVPIVEIDHMDGNSGQIANVIKRVRYFDNYRDTLIRIAKSLQGEHEFVWVCSSICDYTGFDFTWHPEKWQQTMLHVFASDGQKFGDTFYMHVPTFAERAEKKALLEWYSVNFVPRKSVPRRPLKSFVHAADTHVDIIQDSNILAPLVVYSTVPVPDKLPAVPLWREETKAITPLDGAASTVIVPREAKSYIKTQLYDYPYIDKTYRNTLSAQLQDVVFISYDEPEADRNWEILKQQCPRAKRVHGVAGMELALEAAADVAKTPWYFAVFAKTRLHKAFDFSFVPDFMQQPKHYIFNCRNASNGLEYGHMGMVLYNSAGIRKTNQAGNFGLDYTLSFPHESVPILSCHGEFATTPYHAWRTAFRETAKLAYFESVEPSVDNQYRLGVWLDQASGDNADWVLTGAKDGYEFFISTQGNLDKLKQSFRWEWLREYFKNRYGDLK